MRWSRSRLVGSLIDFYDSQSGRRIKYDKDAHFVHYICKAGAKPLKPPPATQLSYTSVELSSDLPSFLRALPAPASTASRGPIFTLGLCPGKEVAAFEALCSQLQPPFPEAPSLGVSLFVPDLASLRRLDSSVLVTAKRRGLHLRCHVPLPPLSHLPSLLPLSALVAELADLDVDCIMLTEAGADDSGKRSSSSSSVIGSSNGGAESIATDGLDAVLDELGGIDCAGLPIRQRLGFFSRDAGMLDHARGAGVRHSLSLARSPG